VSTKTSPHVILIVADDLAWNSIGYSSDELAFVTPRLTALGESGIIMDNFYAQEVCSPSRGSLLTGRYPLSIGMQYGMVAANAEWGMPLDETTLAEVLGDGGYNTHMLGKWHLGYFSPKFLPTARGFDSWTGYANGENYYWSKKNPDYPQHSDFISANTTCYSPYSESDKHDYSTVFYTNKAVEIIENNGVDSPLFLYVAYQAVHDPFIDYGKYDTGIPDSYFEDSVLSQIRSSIVGKTRQEYAKALYLMDKGVGQIVDALDSAGMLDNSYVIFMSDNGGCMYGGGKNGPLRGSKGALFEGGIKVDSFIYSPLLGGGGTVFSGLMHVSDWFPTILALTGVSYVATEGYEFDGVNQLDGWMGKGNPRSALLYNMYQSIADYNFDIWTNGSFAVRDGRYKLMHTYDDPLYGDWYSAYSVIEDDDELDSSDRCAQQFVKGKFTYWFFDLLEDPYETSNLYSSTNQLHTMAKAKLYTLLPGYMEKAKTKKSIEFSDMAEVVWSAAGNHILPWANLDESSPVLCL
jgi:arylsulfatase A-like enzyme